MKKPRYILWCDFETTGLGIETLAPIEVAFELTDTNFDEKVALRLHATAQGATMRKGSRCFSGASFASEPSTADRA